ncbi:transcriptional regulation of mitochondrial recombination-domain-containing protein [Halteromyces radiatus]|uniref:transcriptional regulation of mitochondrial recombination-domain-containing protein n=1 Tax=Halteromyces radiatus TaxID=101107 RepID=UPI00221E873B|nr:transcriptional regulation of mitochondrial recombination-domain-containing protein [Halteromyces radiatus]KAI8097342.1 transcriptional regulation of mitochondrial recombination-domain-containing protein [Halteromyces radiatus]
MASHSVYLFRHIQTQQVLVSTRQVMKNKALQQLDITNRPVRLRKDLWRPMVALTGFNTSQSAQAVSDALLQRSKARQLDFKTTEEHLARPKRLRQVDEQDLVEKSVVSLLEALEKVATTHIKNDEKLLALWEQPRFMDLKGDKEWPAFVEHGQLELKNNRFVKTSEDSSA